MNFTTRDDLADQKFLLPLQQVGMKIHQVVNSLKDAVVIAAATNRTLGKYSAICKMNLEKSRSWKVFCCEV